ncbi:MAG: MmcQ/YjbR family DNA-binding protein [Chitinophagaceae bacterium]|nr:MmcQ/YjbR family DNA-binding protein [Chitinophagaceae bacterium]
MFLLTGLDTEVLSFNIKCDPEKAVEMREQYQCVQPGFHMNKTHWNTVTVDGTISNSVLKEWINDSYNLVKSKKKK